MAIGNMENQDHILGLYKRLREASRRLSSSLVRLLSKDAFEESARELGMFARGAIVLDSEVEMDILTDYCVHVHREGGRNSVQRLIETAPPPTGSDDELVLDAMARGYYS